MMEPEQRPPALNHPPQPPAGLPPHHSPSPSADWPNQDDRTLAMLIHLLSLLTGFLGPLILWLVTRDRSPFIDFHGKESINNMITVTLISIALGIFSVVTLGIGLVVFVPYLVAVFIFEIIACVEANKGRWHRIPLVIRLIS
ncbi:DUF4870 domain-containing protein [Roseibacillus ishigakijimensis]|uniref:DUF4870 domain-containing protein n=1 Tax=Roseibacillus ishigakijimensis TaxID=454146 RepID=A0A934VMC6_9BACT|nr:DUF4870 domain-containing protein [Roseibacillus ishigakijimensis]MBK1833810.1 DUF4870 domain-containing protein [Roseibacillus ishigakijimensis]